ncbi:MAG: amidohydrolase [Deltaproteobacteria bacterium]|nr:amidohydrolase [Deltaproteobacteria bacterium]
MSTASKLATPATALAALTAFGLFASAGLAAPVVPVNPAELILKNGKVYTDPLAGPTETHSKGGVFWSQAISIREGNIMSIGTDRVVERDRGPSTRVIDLKGRVVLPGFNDAHVHLMNGGLALTRIDLAGVTTVAQLQQTLRAYAAANPAKRWLLGQGWDEALFPGRKSPTKEDVDAAVSDRPVLLWHGDQHSLLLNTKAFEALRITASTPSPKNGEIQKNDKGELTGLLLEEAAFEAAQKADNPGFEELRTAFLAAQDLASRYGITSVQGGPIRGEEEVRVVEELYQQHKLHLRYSMWGDLEKPQELITLRNKYKHLPDDWVRFDAVKGFVDGVLHSRTAALDDPYSDDIHSRGEPLYTPERLAELVLTANRLGLTVALHAIGDRAVTMAVNAFAASKRQLFNSRLRNRVEHIEVAPPYVFSKFADHHIVASMQPSHMMYENEAANYNEARLGPVRVKEAFAVKAFVSSNAHVAFGTDWPVESLNPIRGLFAAVFRQMLNGKPAQGWQPAQKIPVSEAVDAYTLEPAYATREEHVKGSLREGKYADLVVLDQDIFKARDRDFLKTGVYLTVAGGKIVYDGSQPEIRAAK